MKNTRRLIPFAISLVFALSLLLGTHQPARAEDITVTTHLDTLDAAATCVEVIEGTLPGPDGVVSLREAMCYANNTTGGDTISFAIPGAGLHIIDLVDSLPPLVDGDVTIDGYTQGAAEPAEDGTPATILIEVDGTGIIHNGFNLISSGNEIRGLAIYGFILNGVYIANYNGSIANNNVIAGNYIGINSSGMACRANGLDGVFIGAGAQNNTIGGYDPAARNLISCNNLAGVEIHGSGTTGNVVSGNYIGISAVGTTTRANRFDGVRIYGGAQNNTVGGDFPGERNIISGNYRDGVRIVGEGTNGNFVMGNYIGLEPDGTNGRSNDFFGVYIGKGAQNNTIGGSRIAWEGNVISRNLVGVVISDTTTMSNTIAGNYIGTNHNGTLDAGNSADGVGIIGGAKYNLIGGDIPARRNVISGNDLNGVYISDSGTTGNVVSGNYIGLDHSGTAGIANSEYGVEIINGAYGNTIGGITEGTRNVISSNDGGVRLDGSGTISNTVSGNYIGTDTHGTGDLGNFIYGIVIEDGASNNTIGGSTGTSLGGQCTGVCNLVSGNGSIGILINDIDTTGNIVSGNFIGTNVSGMAPLGNDDGGIRLDNLAYDNTIGPDNLIAGNGGDGVDMDDDVYGNTVYDNYIGVNTSGTDALSNTEDGISIRDGSYNNTIGPDNIIAGNGSDGVEIHGDANGNTVFGNYIGVDASGTNRLGNDENGVLIRGVSSGNTIGPDNVISGNDDNGVRIQDDHTDDNFVIGNYIGTGASGTSTLGNRNCGVSIGLGTQGNDIGGDEVNDRNIISANGHCGIRIGGADTTENTVAGNYIGTDVNGTLDLHNGDDGGVHITGGAYENTIGPDNLIAFNYSNGIRIVGPGTVGNLITQNSIHDNEALGIDLHDGGNNMLDAPNIDETTIGTINIAGTACGGCTVEVFENSDNGGEGEHFVGETDAEIGGDWALEVDFLNYVYLTATATDPLDGTSEFSAVFTAMIPILSTSTKTVEQTTAFPGDVLTYTITLFNTGNVAANTQVTDTLPTGVTWANNYNVSAGTLTWDAVNNRLLWNGTVNVGIPVTIVYEATVNIGVPNGTVISNNASVDDGANEAWKVGPANVTVIANYLYLPIILQ